MNLSPALQQSITLQHTMLDALINGITPEHLNKQPAPDKWSINDQLAHLAVYQPVFNERIHKILNEENPSFGRYNADTDELFLAGRKKSAAELNNLLKKERDKLVILLNSLTAEQMHRKGTHPLFGAMNISQWIEFFVLHEAHHLFSIFKLRNFQQPT